MRIVFESLLVVTAALVPLAAAADPLIEPVAGTPLWIDALSSAELDALRGGADTSVVNNNLLTGTVGDNVASNLVTGSNSVAGGSFANASGLPVVIQNSGNNVLIQNSTIVNIRLQ